MATLRRKRSGDELGKLVADKRMELREHRRAHRGWFREGLHEQVDARIREAEEGFEALLAHLNGADGVPPLQATALGRPGLLDFAALWHLAHDQELRTRLHEHVDALTRVPQLMGTRSA